MSKIDLRDDGHEKALNNVLDILSSRLKGSIDWQYNFMKKDNWIKVTRDIIDHYKCFESAYESKIWQPKEQKPWQ